MVRDIPGVRRVVVVVVVVVEAGQLGSGIHTSEYTRRGLGAERGITPPSLTGLGVGLDWIGQQVLHGHRRLLQVVVFGAGGAVVVVVGYCGCFGCCRGIARITDHQ